MKGDAYNFELRQSLFVKVTERLTTTVGYILRAQNNHSANASCLPCASFAKRTQSEIALSMSRSTVPTLLDDSSNTELETDY